MTEFKTRFVGVVHLTALPGAPGNSSGMASVIEAACRDAAELSAGGVDAIIVENFGDVPFFAERVPPETVAGMALAIGAVQREAGSVPVGVNVLRNDARSALGLCAATGASFLRVNVHSGAAVTDQGWVEGRAAETLRERMRLCPTANLWADVHVKHARSLYGDDLAHAAQDTAKRGGADAIIISGKATGHPPQPSELAACREALPDSPLIVGSGLTAENAKQLLEFADGAIVGTCLKAGGRVDGPVERQRVEQLRSLFDAGR